MKHLSVFFLLLVLGLTSIASDASDGLGGNERSVTLTYDTLWGHHNATVEAPGPQHVSIEQQNGSYVLLRNGEPYFIKGVGGRRYLQSAAAAGANSVRTWGAQNAGRLLDQAQGLNMTVMLGIWLSHRAEDYGDTDYTERKTAEIMQLVEKRKSHPALLCWAIGNEINLEGADTEAAWRFVNGLAELIKQADPHHPVISVIAFNATTLENIQRFAPALDAVGINAYGTLPKVRAAIDLSAFDGPYIITEWGVEGHWEVRRTAWGRPIEPTSSWKAAYQLAQYQDTIIANNDRCLGAYVFLWGNKQERTSTWYSMVLDDPLGGSDSRLYVPAVDAMQYNWTGNWPANRAPEVTGFEINRLFADNDIVLRPSEPIVSRIQAHDPDNDDLTFVWELLEEPVFLGTGGAFEPRPVGPVRPVPSRSPELAISAPASPGEYRLFVYVLDHRGHVATANLPFHVSAYSETAENVDATGANAFSLGIVR